jgi:hypothetical protein
VKAATLIEAILSKQNAANTKTNTHYRCTPTEDPFLHIRDFFDLCKTQNVHGLNTKGIRLILFPFSLKDNAKLWLNSLAAGVYSQLGGVDHKVLEKVLSSPTD